MNRSRFLIASIGGAAILSFAQAAFATTANTRIDYPAAMEHASAVYKDGRARCDPLGGHEQDMCVVEAKAAEKRAKALVEADFKGTVKAKTDSRIANADADFMVAEVACDAQTGQKKNVCVKQAKAVQVKLVADAKADKTAVDARAQAQDDTRVAQYKVAVARCDAMSGTERDTCVTAAKSKFGQ